MSLADAANPCNSREWPEPRSRRFALILLPVVAALLAPAMASAQFSTFSSLNADDYNSGNPVALGSSTVMALDFIAQFSPDTLEATPAVVTQGAASQDFTLIANSCPVGIQFSGGAICVETVTFAPKAAGLRMGAITFNTPYGFQTFFIYGMGAGPQVAYGPPVVLNSAPTGSTGPQSGSFGLALDGAGNLYVSDALNNRILKIPAGGGSATILSPTVNSVGLSGPVGLAVDGAGDLFIADKGNNRVVEMPTYGSPPQPRQIDPTVSGLSLNAPTGLAADAQGDLYISDTNNNRVVEVPASGAAATAISPTVNNDTLSPYGLALDAAGDLYIADPLHSQVVLVPAAGGVGSATAIQPAVNGVATFFEYGVAVDAAGDLFVADSDNNRVVEVPANKTGDFVVAGASSSGSNVNVVVDSVGDLYTIDKLAGLIELKRPTVPAANFPTTTVDGTTDTNDGTQVVQVFNIGNAPLTFSGVNYPADFPQGESLFTQCTGSTVLAVDGECDVAVEFIPAYPLSGPLSENIQLTDNASSSPQSIAATGTAFLPPASHFSVSAPISTNAGQPISVTVTALTANGLTATAYTGTVAITSSDGAAVLPAPSTLTNGSGTFSVTLKTYGSQTVTATDTGTATITGLSNTIDVGAVAGTIALASGTGAFGAVALGSNKPANIQFSIGAGVNISGVSVVTQGATGLDFSLTSNNCASNTGGDGVLCQTTVTFTPKAPGLRVGALTINGGSGPLFTLNLYGVGSGPQIAFRPGTLGAITLEVSGRNLVGPTGVAVDAAGNTYVTDETGNQVVEFPAAGGAVTISPTGLSAWSQPTGLAIDGAGDLFVADQLNQRIVEIPAGGGPAIAIDPTVNGLAVQYPTDVKLDGAGDLFIVDTENKRIVEVPAGGGAPIAIIPMSAGNPLLFQPTFIALDAAGDLFIRDIFYRYVVKVPFGGGTPTTIAPIVNGSGIAAGGPAGIAVDAAGDLYIADNGNARVLKVPADGSAAQAISPAVNGQALAYPEGIALDSAGNLYIVDTDTDRLLTLTAQHPAAVSFKTATPVGTTDTTDGTQTVSVTNIGNQPLKFSGLTYPADFPNASSGASGCTSSTSLAAGSSCALSIKFSPVLSTSNSSTLLKESISLTDNNLNGSSVVQSVNVSGTEVLPKAALTSPAPGNALAGPKVTFTWSAASGATGYSLRLGTTAGANNIYGSGTVTQTSATPASLPTNGETIHARLTTYYGVIPVFTDYTFPAASQAALTAPASGAALTGPKVTFTWSAAPGATGYSLRLGTTAGANNLYGSGTVNITSATATSLPANGETIHARLTTYYGVIPVFTDYTFTAATQAILTAPTPGSVLTGPKVTFTWSAASGATGYSLRLGTTAGANNIYGSGTVTQTSATPASLPTNGETIHARLTTYYGTIPVFTDYVFTAAP